MEISSGLFVCSLCP